MIAADNDRCRDRAALYQIVHGNPKLGAFAIAEPADARRQTLKMDSFSCQFHPTPEGLVLWKNFERKFVCPRDVLRIAAQRHPAKWTFPFAEQRPDIFRNEPGNIKGVFDTGFFRLRADVVPVIESNSPALL